MRVVFVHGACVKDGSWWWHRTAELLAERGVASAAPPATSSWPGDRGLPRGWRPGSFTGAKPPGVLPGW